MSLHCHLHRYFSGIVPLYSSFPFAFLSFHCVLLSYPVFFCLCLSLSLNFLLSRWIFCSFYDLYAVYLLHFVHCYCFCQFFFVFFYVHKCLHFLHWISLSRIHWPFLPSFFSCFFYSLNQIYNKNKFFFCYHYMLFSFDDM